MEKAIAPFEFRQCASILKSTGEKARNLRELREIVARGSEDKSIELGYGINFLRHCSKKVVRLRR